MQAFARKRLRLEALERRLCLACDISFTDGELVVEGDGDDNVVAITADGEGGVTVVCDGEEYSTGEGEIVLPEGHFFVMGMNPSRSWDSRYFGAVSADQIVAGARPLWTF